MSLGTGVGRIDVGANRLNGGWIVAGIGVVIALAGVVDLVLHDFFLQRGVSDSLFQAVLIVGFAVVVVGVGVRLARSSMDDSQLWHAVRWCAGGVVVLLALVAWGQYEDLVTGRIDRSVYHWFVIAGNLGGMFGAVAGMNRARTAQSRELAQETAEQRETLAFVNYLLRHHVLNAMNIITGFVEELGRDVDEDREELVVIERQSERIVRLVENVRVLASALSGELAVRRVDLGSVLRAEVEAARHTYPEATFETSIPGSVEVSANDALGAVFENLLRNAIQHHDQTDPTVTVDIETHEERVAVRIADDGPGISDEVKQAYDEDAERGGGVGENLGLYLVTTLVDQFQGATEITDNEPRGTVVTVTLPRP